MRELSGIPPGQHHQTGKRQTLDRQWLIYLKRTGLNSPSSTVEKHSLDLGIRLCNNKDFFASHEAFEAIWRASRYPEKLFLLALAKLMAAFVHAERGQIPSARRLTHSSLGIISTFLPVYLGVNTALLDLDSREWAANLEYLPNQHRPRIHTAGM